MDDLNFTPDIYQACSGVLLGKRIAVGAFREVYVCALDEMFVVKIERYTGEFHNIREWEVWQQVEHWSIMAKWFAPCKFISPCGKVLIQYRTMPLKQVPRMLPIFFTDLKKENFGKIGKQTVCHDYSLHLFVSNVTGRKVKMRKVRKDFQEDCNYTL